MWPRLVSVASTWPAWQLAVCLHALSQLAALLFALLADLVPLAAWLLRPAELSMLWLVSALEVALQPELRPCLQPPQARQAQRLVCSVCAVCQ